MGVHGSSILTALATAAPVLILVPAKGSERDAAAVSRAFLVWPTSGRGAGARGVGADLLAVVVAVVVVVEVGFWLDFGWRGVVNMFVCLLLVV